jgi:hypothetical protein
MHPVQCSDASGSISLPCLNIWFSENLTDDKQSARVICCSAVLSRSCPREPFIFNESRSIALKILLHNLYRSEICRSAFLVIDHSVMGEGLPDIHDLHLSLIRNPELSFFQSRRCVIFFKLHRYKNAQPLRYPSGEGHAVLKRRFHLSSRQVVGCEDTSHQNHQCTASPVRRSLSGGI